MRQNDRSRKLVDRDIISLIHSLNFLDKAELLLSILVNYILVKQIECYFATRKLLGLVMYQPIETPAPKDPGHSREINMFPMLIPRIAGESNL